MLKKVILLTVSIAGLAVILSLTVFRDTVKSVFYIDHMERGERINRMNIETILSKLKIREGDHVADIGAGSGLFTRKFSSMVSSSGRVYAVDINRELLEHIEKTGKEKGITNIQTVTATENDPRIPGQVDLIFICDTLHYIEKQEKYVETMSRYLKPSGRIAVISFYQKWPPMSNRFTEKELTAWMQKASLEKTASYRDFIQDEYLAIYRKKH